MSFGWTRSATNTSNINLRYTVDVTASDCLHGNHRGIATTSPLLYEGSSLDLMTAMAPSATSLTVGMTEPPWPRFETPPPFSNHITSPVNIVLRHAATGNADMGADLRSKQSRSIVAATLANIAAGRERFKRSSHISSLGYARLRVGLGDEWANVSIIMITNDLVVHMQTTPRHASFRTGPDHRMPRSHRDCHNHFWISFALNTPESLPTSQALTRKRWTIGRLAVPTMPEAFAKFMVIRVLQEARTPPLSSKAAEDFLAGADVVHLSNQTLCLPRLPHNNMRQRAFARDDCTANKAVKHVSQLKWVMSACSMVHHESHEFFYCLKCFNSFPSAHERDVHILDGCSHVCVNPTCLNSGAQLSACGHRDNTPQAKWMALSRLYHQRFRQATLRPHNSRDGARARRRRSGNACLQTSRTTLAIAGSSEPLTLSLFTTAPNPRLSVPEDAASVSGSDSSQPVSETEVLLSNVSSMCRATSALVDTLLNPPHAANSITPGAAEVIHTQSWATLQACHELFHDLGGQNVFDGALAGLSSRDLYVVRTALNLPVVSPTNGTAMGPSRHAFASAADDLMDIPGLTSSSGNRNELAHVGMTPLTNMNPTPTFDLMSWYDNFERDGGDTQYAYSLLIGIFSLDHLLAVLVMGISWRGLVKSSS
ncbi:uncharacterized protein MYCFIDRAFT_180022 [Pseudocercospora fijiensis CIRAD86]|uniref:Uncharacterized protein n=1 Tax=Pseudocercospora fijiensis (strain CIRAD86) TaxID=383855 RepID=M3AJW3_PSEFD|nr:uncharacterized protein MYCFIDRAFT_180022 [Pseudocercospora fijiensis CIRAD86]EME77463.1 hypothetical protein MYCFIDRAFT_180022 [Pseudocercospora fijiensis CIRAD86]